MYSKQSNSNPFDTSPPITFKENSSSAPPLPDIPNCGSPLLETDFKEGVACGKVKGYITIDFQVSGLTKKETGFIRLICGLVICECFHNIPIPSEYLASLVSELYKRFKTNKVTYTPGVKGNLLWGKTQLKWMTGSCITPLDFLELNTNITHAFPMTASLDTIVHVKFNATLKTRPYLNMDAVQLLESGFAYVETFFKKLECKEEILFLFHIRQTTALFNFNSVLQQYSDAPSQPIGKSEQSFQAWDVTPIKLYKKANFFERVLLPASSQRSLQLLSSDVLLASPIKYPWK